MIEVTGLVKKYGNHVAVDHLSFRLEPGKIYGFLGPNGAGKSTTMNMMTGYIGPTEGTILINGHDIVKEPAEAKRCIGYLPELPPLYTDMTVWEYLEFAAQLKNIPAKKRQESILNAMKMTGLVDVAKRLIKNLSKGYRQRVGFAQAVLGMPEIIILDEPTVGLDPIQIIEIRSLIKELAKEHTVILSSHILSEISAYSDADPPTYVALYEDSADGTSVIVSVIVHQTPAAALQEKDNSQVRVYESGGVEHYIMENNEKLVATWFTDNLECSITGEISEEDLETMINSIYEE